MFERCCVYDDNQVDRCGREIGMYATRPDCLG
jgi:hypothetical protein